MKELNLGQILNVQAYKHDGTLYRQWNGVKVIETSPDVTVMFMFKSKVVEKNGQKWIVREPMIWFFPHYEWCNTTALIRKSGTFFYTNLASRPLFEDGVLKFIDYDLDIKSYPGSSVKVVDRAEFERHQKQFEYPKKLIDVVEKTCKQVLKLIRYEDGYFNEDVINQYVDELVESRQISLRTKKDIRE